LSEWLFLGEQTEAGIIFQLVINKSTGRYYRFEPLAAKLRGNLMGLLRQDVENRRNLIGENQAILGVIGPIYNVNRCWLGWKERKGQYLFSPEFKKRRPLDEKMADLFPLIHSYYLWHQAGLVVGRPEWTRLFVDNKGVFMLDPKPLGYLAKPFINPQIALERSRPPEEYQSQPLGPAGDVFYLGLIIYYYMTGETPYQLHNGWPTRAIMNGTILDPQVYFPDIPSELGQMMLSMLVPDPLQRPTSEMLREFWHNCLLVKPVLLKTECRQRSKSPAYLRKRIVFSGAIAQWALPFGLLVVLIISLTVYYLNYKKNLNLGIRPLNAAADFYRAMKRVDFQIIETTATHSLTNDFKLAARRRLEMITALLSKPLFEVERMKVTTETEKTAIVEADLIWWEWSAGGWKRRIARERLCFQKQKNKWRLLKRSKLHEH
jgi:serine/threonine protein kinase